MPLIFDTATETLFSLETFNEAYFGLSSPVQLTLIDLKGFKTHYPILTQVTVVADANSFHQTVTSSMEGGSLQTLLQEVKKTNDAYVAQNLSQRSKEAVKRTEPVKVVRKGQIYIDREQTFGQVTVAASLSSQGVLKLEFSRPLHFPKAVLNAFVEKYEPTPPKFVFEMTNIEVETTKQET